jgi:hypothetical protein
MKSLRLWFWRSVETLLAIGVQFARIRSARVCGCDNCRILYDPKRREELVKDMFTRFGGIPDKTEAKPS